jgi:hypothetical protein
MGENPSQFKGEKNLPVTNVSWNHCQEFIKKLREKDKKAYRLPTEAEWEYACRAGTTTPFHFGETISTDQANFNGEIVYGKGKKGFCRKKTTPVDTFPANAWGLQDMHGNVFQWCQDWHGEYPEKDAIDPQGPKKGEVRVLRGGSWDIHPDICRSACHSQPFQHRPLLHNIMPGNGLLTVFMQGVRDDPSTETSATSETHAFGKTSCRASVQGDTDCGCSALRGGAARGHGPWHHGMAAGRSYDGKAVPTTRPGSIYPRVDSFFLG